MYIETITDEALVAARVGDRVVAIQGGLLLRTRRSLLDLVWINDSVVVGGMLQGIPSFARRSRRRTKC